MSSIIHEVAPASSVQELLHRWCRSWSALCRSSGICVQELLHLAVGAPASSIHKEHTWCRSCQKLNSRATGHKDGNCEGAPAVFFIDSYILKRWRSCTFWSCKFSRPDCIHLLRLWPTTNSNAQVFGFGNNAKFVSPDFQLLSSSRLFLSEFKAGSFMNLF